MAITFSASIHHVGFLHPTEACTRLPGALDGWLEFMARGNLPSVWLLLCDNVASRLVASRCSSRVASMFSTRGVTVLIALMAAKLTSTTLVAHRPEYAMA